MENLVASLQWQLQREPHALVVWHVVDQKNASEDFVVLVSMHILVKHQLCTSSHCESTLRDVVEHRHIVQINDATCTAKGTPR